LAKAIVGLDFNPDLKVGAILSIAPRFNAEMKRNNQLALAKRQFGMHHKPE
jgi:hypothetical protein